MAKASLGGVLFRTDPHEISWDYKVKVVQKPTLGGKVIQVIGTTLGDMTIQGSFGRGGWEAHEKFVNRMKNLTIAVADKNVAPVKFSYPPRGWNFDVFVKSISGPTGRTVVLNNAEFNPKFTLTLFVVNEGARQIQKGIKDAYIQRLMNGVGWRQSEYNGPITIESALSGAGVGSVQEFFDRQTQDIFDRSLAGTYVAGQTTGQPFLNNAGDGSGN